jgi:hypothetical protein
VGDYDLLLQGGGANGVEAFLPAAHFCVYVEIGVVLLWLTVDADEPKYAGAEVPLLYEQEVGLH